MIFLLAVALEIGGAIPRATEVALPLGSQHSQVTAASVTYTQDDVLVHALELSWAHGAPSSLRHSLDLGPGNYHVQVGLTLRGGGQEQLSGVIIVPAEGVLTVQLRPMRLNSTSESLHAP